MANKLNQIDCITGYKNVGFGTCVFDPKLIKGILLFPEKRTFTEQEIAALQTTLRNLAKADSKSARMYPLHNFVAVADNTEDVVIETTDYGAKSVTRDGDYDWTFKYFDGALCLSTALETFNGPTPFLIYDKNMVIIGSKSNNKLSTIAPHFFHALPWRLATGANAANYQVRLSFTPEQINKYLGYVKADFDLTDIEGLKDVELVVNSYNEGTGVANVTLQTLCNKTNLANNLATELADAALYVVTNQEGGEEIAITNVVAAANKTFDVTIDTGDANYPAAGGVLVLNMRAVSVLEGAGIEGYEGVEVEIELAVS